MGNFTSVGGFQEEDEEGLASRRSQDLSGALLVDESSP